MIQIGTASGTGGMHISSTTGSLFLTTASGSDWIPDSIPGITCSIMPATTILTITTLTFSQTVTSLPILPILSSTKPTNNLTLIALQIIPRNIRDHQSAVAQPEI